MIALFSRTIRGIAHRPLDHLLVTGMVALALLLLGAVRLATSHLDRWLSGWGESAHLVVYLRDDTSDAEAARLAAQVDQVPGVETVRRVRPAEAHRRLRESLGSEAAFLDHVEQRFLPDSLEVRLRAGLWPMARVSPMVERLSASPSVAEVEFAGEWADRLGRVRRVAGAAGIAALILALAVCVYVVGSAARLAAHAQRDEIAIQKLVGATDRFVRAPFLVQGALQGICGAALAVGLLWIAYRQAAPWLGQAMPFALAGRFVFLRAAEMVAGTLLATLTALLGASLAMRRALDA